MIITFTNVIGAIRNSFSVVRSGLKMWLGFETSSIDGDSQITPDKSGNNNVGELFTGKALEFNGSTEYVDVSGFSMSGSISTFAFWINSNDTLGRMIDIYQNRFIISFESNQLSVFDGSWKNFGTISTNVWNRCVIVTSGTSAKCYVNGVQLGVEKTISAINIGSATATIIGAHFQQNQNFFNGKMSDFQIYNSAWTTNDVVFDYANPNILVTDSTNTGTSIAVANLKAYWAMSEGAGSVAYDSSGEYNNGTIDGADYEPAQPRIPQLGMQNWSKGNNSLLYSSMRSNQVGTNLAWETFASAPNTITVTDGETAPDGTSTAWLVNGTGAFFQTNIDASIRQTRRSIWAKTVSGTGTAHLLSNNSNSGTLFNITNEWQRFDLLPISGQVAPQVFYAADLRGSSTLTQIILWGPQIQSDSILNDYRPTDADVVPVTTIIPNPNTPTKDIYANLVRNRLNSFNLDGSGYAEVADDASINPTTEITIQCWIQSNTENDKGLVAKWIGTKKDYMLYKTTNKFSLYIGTTPLQSGTLPSSGWVNIAGTYNGSTMKTFINGVESTSQGRTGSIPNSDNVLDIGRYAENNTYCYSERISDVLLYDTALDADEIENNYNAGLSAHTNN